MDENEPDDLQRTTDVPDPNKETTLGSNANATCDPDRTSAWEQPNEAPRSTLPNPGRGRPIMLRDAEADADADADAESPTVTFHAVKPHSNAMPHPAIIGNRYQLFGEIARGGMGAVLRGRDGDLGRDLAVKVLLEKHAQRPDIAQRFLEEAQIGGQLQHPGVVPVYDIGKFGDLPFFTMKLIQGQTFAALLAARTDPTADRPRMLGIMLHVAQTLAYAHAKGVIHRDLKPANIMVGAFGEVQVMDWGLAKVLAEQEPKTISDIRTARSNDANANNAGIHTETGSVMGTLAYMPPEQANGDIANLDRRADVFGLGAILCEILTGKPPYTGKSFEEIRRKAVNADLAEAHTRLDNCGADEELINLAKACLFPKAADRPVDAQVVTYELTAYLDGVQERLRQAELAEAEARARAIEERKRRRLTLALATTVLTAVTLGGGIGLWIKTDRDARQLQLVRDVNDAVNTTAALREQARTALTVSGAAALFAQAREQSQRAGALIENGPADQALQDQVRQLQTELDEEENDRKLVAALENARLAQTEIAAGQNRFASVRAIPLFREAFRTYGPNPGEGDPAAAAERIRQRPPSIREIIIASLDEWIHLSTEFSQPEPHLEWLNSVVAAAEPKDGWTQQFRHARQDKDPAKRRALLEKLADEADVRILPERSLTRLAELLENPRAVRLLRRTWEQYPADVWVNHNLGYALGKATPPDLAEAVRYLTCAVTLRPESPGFRLNLGNALSKNGRLDEGIANHRKAIELNPNYAAAYNNLGNALSDKGRLDEAMACYRKAIELDPKFAMTYINLGNELKAKERWDEAVACYLKATELDPKDATAHYSLGTARKAKGQWDEAVACYRKAIELDPKFAFAHNGLGTALKAKGQLDEAVACYRKAIELDPKFALAHNALGAALKAKGQWDEAAACYRKAIELDPKDVTAYINLGNELKAKERLDEAVACYRKALELDPKNATTHYNLGAALKAKGRLDEAMVCYRKAMELDPKDADTQNSLKRLERMAVGRDKFPAFRDGRHKPASLDECLGIMAWCASQKFYKSYVSASEKLFAMEPKLPDDLETDYRYDAACYAALAADRRGEDASRLDDKECARLRGRALEWLRANLAYWTRQLESGEAEKRALVRQTLAHWRKDADLTGIRDETALGKLPAEERRALTQLWNDVAVLAKKAEAAP